MNGERTSLPDTHLRLITALVASSDEVS
jgi:hypothetical protein